jgi:hypothetical protein
MSRKELQIMANKIKSTNEATAETEKSEKSYSQGELDAIVAEAVKQALASYEKDHRNDTTVYNREEYVTLLYIGAIAEGTVVSLGKLGQINKAGATRDIPKKEFLQGMTFAIEKMLENRSLIVVNGLTSEERERYGLDYKEGELLTQEAFYKLLNYSDAEITAIFRKLCEDHRRVVAKMFLSAYFEKSDNRITAEKVKSLNEISKENDKDGMFKPILEDMGDRFAD